METIKVRVASKDDTSAVVQLLDEVDQFYGDRVVEGANERAENVASALFGTDGSAHVLLASTGDGQIIAFASYSFLWPAAGSSKSLFLKEMYVVNGHRGSGVGRQLMRELFDIAKRKKCSRVEWTTDIANTDAQGFYERLGESAFSGKLFYRHEIDS